MVGKMSAFMRPMDSAPMEQHRERQHRDRVRASKGKADDPHRGSASLGPNRCVRNDRIPIISPTFVKNGRAAQAYKSGFQTRDRPARGYGREESPRGGALSPRGVERGVFLWTAAARCPEEQGESIFTWQVLCFLVRHGPHTQRDLAYANAQHPAGLSRLLEELEAEGLITRAADPRDRRKSLVKVTAKGKARFEAASPAVWRGVDEALVALTPKQRLDLRALLGILVPVDAPAKSKASAG